MSAAVRLLPNDSRQGSVPDVGLCPTVYHEDWWLDICSQGQIRTSIAERHGVVLARLPYVLTRRLGFVFCGLPSLTHFGGPAFAAMNGSPLAQMQRRNDLTNILVAQLPPCHTMSFKLHHGITDTLAFQRQGFRTSVQFSFEVAPATPDALWANIRRGHRRAIREAMDLYALDMTCHAAEFVALYAANVANSGKRFRYDPPLVTRLLEACLTRDCGRILCARDAAGVVRAALFVTWDQFRMYTFLGTRDAAGKDAAASPLLIWAAMQDAARRGLVFDFDGVFNAGQVQYFAGFGGKVTPRYIVSRTTRVLRLVQAARGLTQSRREQIF